MSNLVYADVPIGGTSIFTFRVGEEVYIPLRTACEALGLDWSNERRRIKGDKILSQAVVKFTTATSRGQEVDCLPLSYLPGWMFKIPLKSVAPNIQPLVETMQREGYRVLNDYWTRGVAVNPRAAQIEHSERTARRRELPALLEKLKTEDHPEVRRIIYHMVVKSCESEGVEPPAFDAIAPPPKPRPMIAERFFEALAELREKGVVIDWHRDPAMLALPLREVDAAFRQHGISASRGTPLWAALRAHPAFEMTGAVNCHDDRSRHCWVFVRAKLPVDLPYPEKPSSI